MATNINTILSWFKTGLKPTQAQFWASWQSFWHKDEQIPQSNITDLTSTLNAKAEKSQLEGHNHDPNAHEEAIGEKLDKGGYTGTAKDIDERIAAIENPDRILKFGTINIAGLAITIEANAFAWVLNKVTYLIPDAFTETIPAATAGMYRNDILVGNQFGQYSIIEGIEAANGEAAAEPAVPTGTIKLGFISVFGTAIASSGSTPSIEKTTMVDADRIVIDDSADSFSKKSVKWVSIKTSLKTWFDTIYLTQNSNQEVSGVKTFLAGKLGLRNAANTFTSFFANSNTAARTYTLQNRNGIIADNNDLATKQKTFAGIYNFLPKSSSDTDLIPSRIQDTGSFIGFDTSMPPTKDVTLSNKSNKTLGVEFSQKTVKGRDFEISAGSTISYNFSELFVDQNIATGSYNSVAVHPTNNNVYLSNSSVGLFVNRGGIGVFENVTIPKNNLRSISILPNGDVYAFSAFGEVMRQVGGLGAFTLVSGITQRTWESVFTAANGNMLATVNTDNIYLRTGAAGDFVSLGQTARSWTGVCELSNGDRYAAVSGGDIYKQIGGIGNFIPTGQAVRGWKDMTVDSSDNVYCVVNGGDVYVKYNGSATFVAMDQESRQWDGIFANNNGDIYACSTSSTGGLFIKYASDQGTANLDGGTLKLKSGTGKGNAQSKIEFITGQKLSSGTDMQIETLRGFIDENGHMIWTNMPTYSDNSAALAGGLPVGCEYKTATGDRKIVY